MNGGIILLIIGIIGFVISVSRFFKSDYSKEDRKKDLLDSFDGDEVFVEKFLKTKGRDRQRLIAEYYKNKGKTFLDDLRSQYGELTVFKNPLTGSSYDFSEGTSYVIDMKDVHKILICESVRTPIGNEYMDKDFPAIFDYNDIKEYELYEEDVLYRSDSSYTSTTKTNTSNLIKRAAVGAVLAGGVGAIIGGATAQTQTETRSQHSNNLCCCSLRIKVAGHREYICIDRYKGYEGNSTTHYDAWHKYIQDIEYVLARIIEENNKN